MDELPLDLTVFLIATFLGALVAGVSGFAFGLVVASIWLYVLAPLQTATLIIAFGLIVQGYSVWKLRHALEWQKLRPFVLGAAIGVPIGVSILGWANPALVKVGFGIFLILYSLYALFRPTMRWAVSWCSAPVQFLIVAGAQDDLLTVVDVRNAILQLTSLSKRLLEYPASLESLSARWAFNSVCFREVSAVRPRRMRSASARKASLGLCARRRDHA